VPGLGGVQMICAVVTDSKIHAVIALPAGSERSCQAAEPAPATSFPWMLVVAASSTWLSWFAHRGAGRPTTGPGRRPFIQALGAWHMSMVGTESTGPGTMQ
jgi:hypothetical protein